MEIKDKWCHEECKKKQIYWLNDDIFHGVCDDECKDEECKYEHGSAREWHEEKYK